MVIDPNGDTFVTNPTTAGLFVVRAWREGDHFRARITYSSDVTCRTETEILTVHSDEVYQHMTTWLQEITSES